MENEDAGRSGAARDRLSRELAEARVQRQRLATQLGGEDPDDPDLGDRADAALQLEGLDDLARLDDRVAELERQLASPPPEAQGLPDGTVVTLRYPDGEAATYRVVEMPEEAPDGDLDVVTAASPLGRALAGRRVGDTVTYAGPGGELEAEVVEIRLP